MKKDHSNKFPIQAIRKKKPEKNLGFNGILTSDLRKNWCNALPTELWSHTLRARSIYWVYILPWGVKWYEIFHIWTSVVNESEIRSWQEIFQFKQLERRSLKKIWVSTGFKPVTSALHGLHSSVDRALHRYHGIRGGHEFESRWRPDFFRLLLSNCSNWKIYCDVPSSLSRGSEWG